MTSDSPTRAPGADADAAAQPYSRLAVAVDGEAGARDAFALARALDGTAETDLIMTTVVPDLSLIVPWASSDPMRHDIEQQMRHMRDEWHPRARIAIDRDRSVARGLMRVVARNHRELLVLGSTHRAEEGQVLISGHARQLIGHLACPLVIAPRGLAEHPFAVRRIGVGVDGGGASVAALHSAARFAAPTGAEIVVCGVVDENPPGFGWPSIVSAAHALWSEAAADEVTSLQATLRELTAPLPGRFTIEVRQGSPAEVLVDLSEQVDLMVVGSRRWGTVARLVLGGTGETLAHASRSPLALVPGPADQEEPDPIDG